MIWISFIIWFFLEESFTDVDINIFIRSKKLKKKIKDQWVFKRFKFLRIPHLISQFVYSNMIVFNDIELSFDFN